MIFERNWLNLILAKVGFYEKLIAAKTKKMFRKFSHENLFSRKLTPSRDNANVFKIKNSSKLFGDY